MMAEAVFFWVLAVLTVGSALGVAVSRNIVRMAVWLLFALTGVAGLFLLLDAEFLAAVQLVVYAGGILVLIIFGIMLTGSAAADVPIRRGWAETAVAVLAAVVIAGGLGVALWPSHARFATQSPSVGIYSMAPIGIALLGEFLVPFELLSVLLLVVMIGAAYLAKSRRRLRAKPGDPT
jgi:NADH:ubiquinone oxidoreductase subunit 6 (subunit J)